MNGQTHIGAILIKLAMNAFATAAKVAYSQFAGESVRDSAVSCLGVVVSFGPDPDISLRGAVLIWRDDTNEYVGIAGDEREPEILKKNLYW